MSTPASGVLLEVQVEHKRYTGETVLAGIGFTLARGEVVSIVGPSGCGKSTLLRIVAGLDTDYLGSVQVNGVPQHGPSPHVGLMFQEPRLLPWLSVADNIGFAAGPHGGRDARVSGLLDEVGLTECGQRLPATLSGGMAQRVAIARALFSNPDLLLLDEPFSAVDAMTRLRLHALLLEIVRAHGMGAVLVTHDLDEALYLSQRVILLGRNPGRIERVFDVDLPASRAYGDPRLAVLRRALFEALDALEI